MHLLPLCDGDVARAIAGLFGRRHPLGVNEETSRVLDALLSYRTVLTACDPNDVITQLKNICVEEPRRVLNLCSAMLDDAERSSDGVQRLFVAGRDLIDISMTLQRLHDHREEGLDLFERLLKMGMYGAHEVLRELNVRPNISVGGQDGN